MGLFDFLKPQPSKQERLVRLLQAAAPAIIPGGKADIEAWGRRVHDAVDGRLTVEECQFIFGAVTFQFALPGDKSENRMVESILGRANGKISRDDAPEFSWSSACTSRRGRHTRKASHRPDET